jgi:hypothetical protein
MHMSIFRFSDMHKCSDMHEGPQRAEAFDYLLVGRARFLLVV